MNCRLGSFPNSTSLSCKFDGFISVSAGQLYMFKGMPTWEMVGCRKIETKNRGVFKSVWPGLVRCRGFWPSSLAWSRLEASSFGSGFGVCGAVSATRQGS